MDEEVAKKLTSQQIACLKLVHAHVPIKLIPERMGLSEEGVNYHLKGARRALGVDRSSQAAMLLFGGIPPTYYRETVAGSSVVGSLPDPGNLALPSDELGPAADAPAVLREASAAYVVDLPLDRGPPMPVPTRGRPWNDLSWRWRLAWIVAIAVGAVLVVSNGLILYRALVQTIPIDYHER